MEANKKNQIFSSLSNDKESSLISKHLLLELYKCEYKKLNDEFFLNSRSNLFKDC